MPTFAYKAMNADGNILTGEVEADSTEQAREILTSRGLLPSKVAKKRPAGSGFSIAAINARLTKIKVPDLILFSKQMGTMIRAGVPIMRMFEVLEAQTENRRLNSIISHIKQDIEEGSTIYAAFKKHPAAFSNLYCSMIEAGEAGGTLPEVLDRLIYIIEHEYKIKSEVKSAMTYPIMVVVALVVAFFVLLTFVVPKFVTIFEKSGIDIPLPTRICMIMYNFLENYWYILLIVVAAVVFALVTFLRTEAGKLTRDQLFIRLPIVGPLFIKSAMSRFASIYAILQASGVPVLEIMQILVGTIGNYAIAGQFEHLQEQLKEGRGIAEPLSTAKYFTPMVVNMVAIGEESGNLDTMLNAVSEHYDVEVGYATERLTAAVGPILIVGLAAVVGFFALAIYLPMWDLTKLAG